LTMGLRGERAAVCSVEIGARARHADIAGDAGMVAVVAAVSGEIEGNRKPLLAGREIAAVEGIRVLGRGETGILPDGPRLRGVHGRIGAAQIRRHAGEGIEEGQTLYVLGPVDRLHRDSFRREPRGSGRWRFRGREIDAREIRNAGHDAIVRASMALARTRGSRHLTDTRM